MVIQTALPKNVTGYQRTFFEKSQAYEAEETKIAELKCIYITHSGIAFKLTGLVSESVYHYPDRQKKYKWASAFNFLCKRRIKFNKLDKVTFIHNYYCPGYYHWLTEALPRLLALQKLHNLSELILVIPGIYPKYVWESLAPFQFKRIVKIGKDEIMFAPNSVFASNAKFGSNHNPIQIQTVNKFFCSLINTSNNKKKKIYITRQRATRRRIVNENEVINLLKTYGFQVVALEQLSFLEQVELMTSTAILVSIHGAGLTNMIFMPAGGAIIEFFKKLKPGEYFNKSYWRLAGACGLDYYCLWCEPEDDSLSFDASNLRMELNELTETLDKLKNLSI